MSWDVELLDKNGKRVEVPSHTEGGTYCVGGTSKAELNVTYNYGGLFRSAGILIRHDDKGEDPSLFRLKGSTGKDSILPLAKAIEKLGTNRDSDYWKSTEGNAGYTLSILLGWAVLNQDAVWNVE